METNSNDRQQLSDADFAEYYPQSQSERRSFILSPLSRLTDSWDPKGKILIPGYGNGGTMIDLSLVHLKNYFGIDLNFHALRKGLLHPRLAQANIDNMPFAIGTFDYAVVSDVIQDFASFDELVDKLTRIKSLMKDKGQIIVVNPTAESYAVETEQFDCSGYGNENAVKQGMGAEVRGVLKDKLNEINCREEDRKKQLPFIDHVWRERDLEKAFKLVGLKKMAKEKPKATGKRLDHGWISENKTAPWVVYLLEVNNQS